MTHSRRAYVFASIVGAVMMTGSAQYTHGQSLFDKHCSDVQALYKMVETPGQAKSSPLAPLLELSSQIQADSDATATPPKVLEQLIKSWGDFRPYDFFGFYLLGQVYYARWASKNESLTDKRRQEDLLLASYWLGLSSARNACFCPGSALLAATLVRQKKPEAAFEHWTLSRLARDRSMGLDPFNCRPGVQPRLPTDKADAIRKAMYKDEPVKWVDPLDELLKKPADRGDYLLIALFQKAAAEKPAQTRGLSEALTVRAIRDLDKGDLPMAEQRLRSAVLLDFTSRSSHLLLARLFEHSGRRELARIHKNVARLLKKHRYHLEGDSGTRR